MATISQAAPPALQPTIAALRAFIAGLNTLMATAGAALDNPNALDTDAGTTSAAYLTVSQALAIANITLESLLNTQTANQTTLMGGSLYDVAAMFYTDPTQAFALMYANNRFTPWLPNSVPVTVNLPPANTLLPSNGVTAATVTPSV